MSTERSSSAVRNLRTLFESKESEAAITPERQLSRNASQERTGDNQRPLSKVRSSFVGVEQAAKMAKTPDETTENMSDLTQVSSASLRRQSFSENGDDHDHLAALKRVVSQESEKREREPTVQEAIPEAAIESTPELTPVVEAKEEQVLGAAKPASKLSSSASVSPTEDTTANPDKPVTSADEEEVGSLKPADLTDAAAVTGGAALSTESEHVDTPAQTNGHKEDIEPAAVQAPKDVPSKAVKSPTATAHKSSNTTAAPTMPAQRDLNRKVSRSSLTAPTAASNARAAEKRESLASRSSPPSKTKPREATRSANISSHLLAPTAASRARHEPGAAAKPSGEDRTSKTSAHAPAKTAAPRPTPRTSLARQPRPDSRSAQQPARKAAPPDGSFLERMTRPTAASQNRVQEKYEVTKTSPRKSGPLHKKAVTSKVNGFAAHPSKHGKPSPSSNTEVEEEEDNDDSLLDLNGSTPVMSTPGRSDEAAIAGAEHTDEPESVL